MILRTRLCLLILLLAPLAVYWQTIFHDYGLRDDYSDLREAREEPGKIVRFTASQGRPIYGALLETSFGVVDEVSNLPWLRLTNVLLLTVLGLALWRQLVNSGWNEVEAAAIGVGMTLLPAAQITAGWAVCWPHLLALVLAVAGFSAIETELERGGLKRIVALLGGGMIYFVAGLIYQSNALFAVVPIAAVLLVRTGKEPMSSMRWASIHLATLLGCLAASFVVMKLLFSHGVFRESPRLALESNPFTKLVWFFQYPLPNALGLFALRDDFNTGAAVFWTAVLLIAATIGVGFRFDGSGKNLLRKKRWLLCLLAMPFLAHAVSLAAAERSVAYRTLFALSGLVLVLVVVSIRSLIVAGRIKPVVHYAALGLLGLGAAITAQRTAWSLIAEPQGLEWDLVRTTVRRADFSKPTKVYLITPTLKDRATERVYRDEFGSLSSDSDWAPREMFKAALHERFPGEQPVGRNCTIVLGRAEPAATAYDLVIDFRKLKEQRGR